MSSRPANDLNRILLGSAIGAVIGLVLLALGVAILWNAADQRLADAPPEAEPALAPVASVAPAEPDQPSDAAASPSPYPTVAPAPAPATPPVPVPAEPPRPAAKSIWRSIFDDDAAAPPEASTPPPAAPRAAPPAPRPAPRSTTPRRPPEAQRQDDSLFF